MYKVFNGKSWLYFKDYIQLINFLSKSNYRFGSEVTNPLLDLIGNNPNDKVRVRVNHSTTFYYEMLNRDHRIVGENDISIYDRNLVNDVHNWQFDPIIEKQTFAFRRELCEKDHKCTYYSDRFGTLPRSAWPNFRNGPVPYIHKRGRYSVYRAVRTTNEKRLSADPETMKYNRGSRGKNLPDIWDDQIRDWRNHGWKRQGKNRHQWEKGFKTKTKHQYGKGIYVCQGVNQPDDEFDIDDVA